MGGGDGDDGDARLLALGCKLQNLVSLRVFGMEGYYICPFRVSLSTVRKEIYKNKSPDTNYGQISFRGQFKLEPHPHWSPLGV